MKEKKIKMETSVWPFHFLAYKAWINIDIHIGITNGLWNIYT
jgi:hypothetical protein